MPRTVWSNGPALVCSHLERAKTWGHRSYAASRRQRSSQYHQDAALSNAAVKDPMIYLAAAAGTEEAVPPAGPALEQRQSYQSSAKAYTRLNLLGKC